MAFTDFGGGTIIEERKKVPTTKRTVARVTSSGGTNLDRSTVQPTQGFTPQPVVEVEETRSMLDLYRDGRIETGGGQTRIDVWPKQLEEREEKIASIRVYGRGTGKGVNNSSADKNPERDFIPPYTKFILQNTRESHQERSQIVETFGEFYLFFFGERPPVYTFSGTLINTKNVNWLADFQFYYENYMRGTKCVEKNARIIITYGGRQIEGYIIEMSTATDAQMEPGVPVTFQVVVTRRNQVGFSDDFGVYTGYFGGEEEDETLIALLDNVAGKEGKGTSELTVSENWNQTKGVLNQTLPAAGPLESFGGGPQFGIA